MKHVVIFMILVILYDQNKGPSSSMEMVVQSQRNSKFNNGLDKSWWHLFRRRDAIKEKIGRKLARGGLLLQKHAPIQKSSSVTVSTMTMWSFEKTNHLCDFYFQTSEDLHGW